MSRDDVGINQRAKEYTKIINSKGCKVFEHRQVWEDNIGEIPKGFFVHHKDGNKRNNNITNLELVNRIEHGAKHLLSNRIRVKYKSGTEVRKII
jgi:hypothetical protein